MKAFPYANVFVDGRKYGSVVGVRVWKLPAGAHAIGVQYKGKTEEKRIVIEANKTSR